MPRLICFFTGCPVILLALSWGGSNHYFSSDVSATFHERCALCFEHTLYLAEVCPVDTIPKNLQKASYLIWAQDLNYNTILTIYFSNFELHRLLGYLNLLPPPEEEKTQQFETQYMLELLVYLPLYYLKMSHLMRKPVYAICEQQRHRSACAST